MIITLAGHVDHGKTSLVRALTGVNTDSLAEEQARGLTIDIGFAYADAGALGFVDVPGHHRFIHNMVAGVATHQYALLVIAADDGPMPQTTEHLDILGAIGVQRGVVALTKCDRISADAVEQRQQEILEYLADTALAGARVMPVSVQDSASIDELREHLRKAAAGFSTAENDAVQFRMAIDRAFNLKGSGLVVTGTVHNGRATTDADLALWTPDQGTHAVRIRELRAQNTPAEHIRTADRAAVNLSGIPAGMARRGAWLTAPGLQPTREVTVRVRVTKSFPRLVRHWTPVHVYHATSHSTGRIALLEGNSVAPGETCIATLVLDEPLLLITGDRLVLRDRSLDTTIGGAEALVPHPCPADRRRDGRRLEEAQAHAEYRHAELLQVLLALGPVDPQRFADNLGYIQSHVQSLTRGSDATLRNSMLVRDTDWQKWLDAALGEVTTCVREQPERGGLNVSELLSVPAPFADALLAELVSQKQLQNTAGRFHLPDQRATLSREEQQLLDRAGSLIDAIQAPSVGDLSKQLRMALPVLQKTLTNIAKKGELIQISPNRFYKPQKLEQLAEAARELSADQGFTVRAFRDRTGVGRNITIEVLEYFDSKGYTRRAGDVRHVVGHWR